MRRIGNLKIAVRDAGIILVLCAAFSAFFNAVRENGISFLRFEAYEVLVPCPEIIGEAEALSPALDLFRDDQVLIVDARTKEAFAARHAPSAINVPYDYLEEIPKEAVSKIAASGKARVAVYGDGAEPDSGEQLARELSGKGIKNVGFFRGGATAVFSILYPKGAAQ